MYSQPMLTEARRDASERAARRFALSGGATLRGGVAEGLDGQAVNRLAALSGGSAPTGAVLFAELDGDPVAAIGIFDGNAVADHTRSGPRMRVRLRLERLFVLSVIFVRGM